jgi:hypothetical protein
VQLPEHLPLPSVAQTLLAQGAVVAVVQAPEPLHTEAVVALPAAQTAGEHMVVASGCTQALPFTPSHVPLHGAAPPQGVRGERGTPFTGVHVPTAAATLHDSHCPSHLPSQQTPSTQNPDAHIAPEEQFAPFARACRHTPVASQTKPAPQEAAVQAVAHFALPSVAHPPFGQGPSVGMLHAPAPLHNDAVVTLPPTQVAAAHTVALSGKVQLLPFVPSHWPLHIPVPPQGSRGLRGAPVMALHVPTEFGLLHDSHCPSQAESQHTPSAQCPVVQSASMRHDIPPTGPFPVSGVPPRSGPLA